MNEDDYYTHHGYGGDEEYGRPVDRSLKYAVVFAVEMDRAMINRAPQAEESLATNRG